MRALATIALLLVGCGSSTGDSVPRGTENSPSPAVGGEDPPDAGTTVQGTVTVAPDSGVPTSPQDAPEAGPSPQPEASVPVDSGAAQAPDSAPPPDNTACIAAACAALDQPACGTIHADCQGTTVEGTCGTCDDGYLCGDNGHANRCGLACLSQYQIECEQVPNMPSNWATASTCNTEPWTRNSDTGVVTYRPGGLTGCTAFGSYWCCP